MSITKQKALVTPNRKLFIIPEQPETYYYYN